MNQSRQIIEALALPEGTNTEIFFDPDAARDLALVMQTPVPKLERRRVGVLLSDDQIADTIGSWPDDKDIRPVVVERLEGWLDEGPGPWKHPWDAQAVEIVEDLAKIAKAITALLKRFKITTMKMWNSVDDPQFDTALRDLMKKVGKEFKINDAGALKFINDIVVLKMAVAGV